MKNLYLWSLLVLFFSVNLSAQKDSTGQKSVPDKAGIMASSETVRVTANAALAAHGGDKLRQMRTFVVRGSVDIIPSASMVIPATFSIVIAGDKYVFELNNPFQPLKQISDGKQMYSSGYELPPVTSLGFPLLAKIGETGYVVAALGDTKKKRNGFRITTPDGFYTDFFIDEKTNKIKGYESSYDVNGRAVTTSVEIDEFQTVEGVVVPKKYSQRFDLGNITAYANFKTKEILINSPVPDEFFATPK